MYEVDSGYILSDSKDDSIIKSKVSRRSLLKWGGALAGAAIVGVGLGFGTDLLTGFPVKKPPVSLSYKPPLSPSVQQTVNTIVQDRIALHTGETTAYANCIINCGGNNACILKLRMNNGVLVGVEPDDTVNAGIPREDSVLTDADYQNGVLQYRPCQRGYSWTSYVNSPDRIIYPMQQTGARGSNNFVRITWDEALDTVASNIQLMLQKYGPYSIGWPYNSMLSGGPSTAQEGYGFTGNVPIGPLAYYGIGTTTWGDPSDDMRINSSSFMTGIYADAFGQMSPWILGDIDTWSGLSRPIGDIFQAKFILLWGVDPTTTTQFLGPYYLRLAREKGIPVVAIDCRYTKTAEVLADQWIPIRPGTDTALILAMCNIMFNENSYDSDYVTNNVEPIGFAKWQDYVLGVSDNIPKTPQWAEAICGIPAETITDLTHLLIANQPVAISWFASPGRIPYGENACRAQIALQAMLGSIVMSRSLPTWASVTPVNLYGSTPPTYVPPQLYSDQGFFKGIVKKTELDNGTIGQDQYFAQIGNATNNPIPNIHMLFQSFANAVNTSMNTNRTIEAIMSLDFFVDTGFHHTTTTSFADIILPIANAFEGGFRGIWTPYPPTIMLSDKLLTPPGEAMDHEWVYVQIAQRLGVAQQYNPNYTTDAAWETMWDELLSAAWTATAKSNNINMDWETFKNQGYYRLSSNSSILSPSSETFSFSTQSGKLEIYSSALDTQDTASYPQPFTNISLHGYDPVYDPPAIPEWVPAWEGFFDPQVSQYPLTLLTPHSRFRAHTCFDSNPLLNGDCYRHSIWMSVSDATQRGIQDGDLVHVYNGVGEIILPAYVTSKIVPGTVSIYKGANYTPNGSPTTLDAEGMDLRGCENMLTSGRDNPVVPPAASGLVQVEKY